jgi:hypothetical protein
MSEDEIKFLSFEEALKIVVAIQEEEDINQENRRILTVYNADDREVCWFDYEETMAAVKAEGKTTEKGNVQDYILRHIPDWSLDI